MTITNPLPFPVLTELAARFGEFMIIGAHARDRIVHQFAGLELSRATSDLDIAIAVPSMPGFQSLTMTCTPSAQPRQVSWSETTESTSSHSAASRSPKARSWKPPTES